MPINKLGEECGLESLCDQQLHHVLAKQQTSLKDANKCAEINAYMERQAPASTCGWAQLSARAQKGDADWVNMACAGKAASGERRVFAVAVNNFIFAILQ